MDYRTLLNTSILIRLFSQSEIAAIQHRDDFEQLEGRVRALVEAIATGNRQVCSVVASQTATLQELVDHRHQETRNVLVTQIKSDATASALDEAHNRLLESLRKPEMNQRKNAIPDSYQDTFKWVFERDSPRLHNGFIEWLEGDGPVYWIQGKPGSGKSCLMKYIVHRFEDERDPPRIRSQRKIMTLSFFCWLAGTLYQKRIDGMLCTLLYQILAKSPPISGTFMKHNPRLALKRSTEDWPISELKSCLAHAVATLSPDHCVYIFIDGLDELDSEVDSLQLISLLNYFKEMEIKLCISSRRSTPLHGKLKMCPGFPVQDLTSSDIELYVHGRIADTLDLQHLPSSDEWQCQMTTVIIDKAQGVFLWVHLVLQNITKGMYFYDSPGELLDRIKKIPDEINALYEDMLIRIGPHFGKYKQEASLCLHACLLVNSEYSAISALQMMFMMSSLDKKILSRNHIHFPTSKLLKKLEQSLARLESICGGLLYLHRYEESKYRNPHSDNAEMLWMCRHEKEMRQLTEFALRKRILFTHRTVRDFLLDSVAGQNLLLQCNHKPAWIKKRLLETQFAWTLAAVDDCNLQYVLAMLRELLSNFEWLLEDARPAQLCLEVVSRINHFCTRFFDGKVPIAQDWVYYLGKCYDPRIWNDEIGPGYAVDFAGFLVSNNRCEPLNSMLKQLFQLSLPNEASELSSLYKPRLYLTYLLVCACVIRPSLDLNYDFSQVLKAIRFANSQLNAILYLLANRPLLVTPWTVFLCAWQESMIRNYIRNDGLSGPLEGFLDAGANLEDTTLFQFSLFYDESYSEYCILQSTANIFESKEDYIVCEVSLAHVLCQIRQIFYLIHGTTLNIKNAHLSTGCWIRPILVKLQAWDTSNAVEIVDEQDSLRLAGKFRRARLAKHEYRFNTRMPRCSPDEEREEFAIPDTDERIRDHWRAARKELEECLADMKQQIQEIFERKDARFVDPELFLKERGYLKDKDDPVVLQQHQEILKAGRNYMEVFKASEVGKDWAAVDQKIRTGEWD